MRCKRSFRQANPMFWPQSGTHDTEAYDLFLRGEYEFHQAESSLAQTPTIVPTGFTGRRWHAIQILSRLLRSS